jgi:transposase
MERTGDDWKPGCNRLAGSCEVLVVNAQHVNAGPGRQTDGKDAAWLAELRHHGLLRASFMPPVAPRERRDLTRYRRTCSRERTTGVNRVQKRLEDATITLAAVASEIMGVSGRARLAAVRAGHAAPQARADLATGRLRSQPDQLAQALDGRVKAPHRVVLTER